MSVNKQILHGVFINKPKLSAIMPKCECIYKKKKKKLEAQPSGQQKMRN